MHVRMKAATFSSDHLSENGGRLSPGLLVEVEPEVAKRWYKIGIAGDPDDPDAVAAMGQNADLLQQQIADLQRQLARARAGQPTETPTLPNQSPYSTEDGLAVFDFLTEQQRVNLQRAGYRDLAAIRDATDDELSDVDRIGAGTVVKLREAATEGDE
jgi:hypothetical protein